MTAALKKTTSVSLAHLAGAELRDHDGRVGDAVDSLVAKLHGDADLLTSVVWQAVSAAVLHHVAVKHRRRRSTVVQAFAPLAKDSVETRARVVMWEFPLADGTPIWEATKSQIRVDMERNYKEGTRRIHNARWQELILQSLPRENSKPRDVMEKDRLDELYQEATNA